MTLEEAKIEAKKRAKEEKRVFFVCEITKREQVDAGEPGFYKPTGEIAVIGARESNTDPRSFSTEEGGWHWPDEPHVLLEVGDKYIDNPQMTVAELAAMFTVTGTSEDNGGFHVTLYKNK